ncbi:MAG: hypothetical protein HZB82_06175 [Deltaproteobacteria bacterium]|nr:hypothetical protein [Deltaproteobacteria bacterium]
MPNKKMQIENNGQVVIYPESIKEGGTPAWRNNNVGNLKFGTFAKDHGAIGFNGEFAVFPDMKTGQDAQVARLKTQKFQSKSIDGALKAYAPKEDNNDTEKYILLFLSSKEVSRLKVSMTPLKPANPIKHHSHAGALAGRTLKRVGDTVYRIENGKDDGSFISDGRKK